MDTHLDYILDRRQLRRKLLIWRGVTFIILVLGVVTMLGIYSTKLNSKKNQPHIARIAVSGIITNSRYSLAQIEKIRKDENVRAVIISINSPGGTTVGGGALYEAFRRVNSDKPIVSSIEDLAASAGYMVAMSADHIVAPPTAIVGSIGVILQYPNASELLAKIGVSVEEIKSSHIKGEPSPFHDTPEPARVMLQTMLLDAYAWFSDLVKERRGFSNADAEGLLDGSIYTGRQALVRRLIDAVGDENTAKAWLVKEKEVDENLEIIDWSLKETKSNALDFLPFFNGVLTVFGLEGWIQTTDQIFAGHQSAKLNGLLSIWQVDVGTVN